MTQPNLLTGPAADIRIGGVATSCGDTPINLHLFSNIEGNLWVGGSVAEWYVPLPDIFRTVLNLYPWGKYKVPADVDYKEYPLYDSHGSVDTGTVYELAQWANARIENGPLLIHCQAGINRSNLVAGLSLVLRGKTPDDAIRLLREKRGSVALCNPTFEAWLRLQG